MILLALAAAAAQPAQSPRRFLDPHERKREARKLEAA